MVRRACARPWQPEQYAKARFIDDLLAEVDQRVERPEEKRLRGCRREFLQNWVRSYEMVTDRRERGSHNGKREANEQTEQPRR